jgi:hypothetical protein
MQATSTKTNTLGPSSLKFYPDFRQPQWRPDWRPAEAEAEADRRPAEADRRPAEADRRPAEAEADRRPAEAEAEAEAGYNDGGRRGNEEKVLYAKATKDYQSGILNTLSFSVGDFIKIISDGQGKMWVGEFDGNRGYFPIDHTETVMVTEAYAMTKNEENEKWDEGGGRRRKNKSTKKKRKAKRRSAKKTKCKRKRKTKCKKHKRR